VGGDDFLDQPQGGGGKSISSYFKIPGQWLQGQIPRAIVDSDFRIKTDMQTKQVTAASFYKDNRPKTDLWLPLQLVTSDQQVIPPEFEDGRALWIISITDYRNEVLPAMEAAGVPRGTGGRMPWPEEGAILTIVYEGPKQIQNQGAPKKVKHCTYQRPAGYAPGQPTAQQVAAGQQATPDQQAPAPQAPMAPPAPAPAPQPQYQPPQPTTASAPPYQGSPPAPMPQPPGPAPAPQAPAPAPMPQPQYAAPAPQAAPQGPPVPQQGPQPLGPDKAMLFAGLQAGQQQAPPAAPAPAPAPQPPATS
jgi:hypothetical protein